MTASLPGHLFLPAAREIEQVRAFMASSASTPGEVAGLDALRLSLLEGVVELERLPLEQVALDEWSRRVVRPLFVRAGELFRLVSRPSFFAELDVAMEKQRGDLRAYLLPHQLDGQTEWAFVTVHLYVNLMGDLLARMPPLTRSHRCVGVPQLQRIARDAPQRPQPQARPDAIPRNESGRCCKEVPAPSPPTAGRSDRRGFGRLRYLRRTLRLRDRRTSVRAEPGRGRTSAGLLQECALLSR